VTGLIIFSRFGSTRLPGKALVSIGSRTLLGHVIARARLVTEAAEIVVATSVDPSDDAIASAARTEGVKVFRGSLEDVAQRAVDCASAAGWTAFARVCGDRYFFDSGAIDGAISRMRTSPEPAADLVTNVAEGPVPPGLTVEVVRVAALRRALNESGDAQDREHVTKYFYAHRDRFRLEGVPRPPRIAEGLRFVVDDAADLARARFIEAQLRDSLTADLEVVADVARRWGAVHA
jgi:spore coat polysaccharide biosynthesis protein SpsF